MEQNKTDHPGTEPSRMDKPRLGITIGDLNGIGAEVIIKTLLDPKILEKCTPVIYASNKVISYHKNIVGIEQFPYYSVRNAERLQHDKVNLANCWQENVTITLGKATDTGGIYAIKSLEAAVHDIQKGWIDGIVTAPVNKQALKMAGFAYPGHTEFLAKELGNGNSLMLMVQDDLRIGLVTGHIPLEKVSGALTKEKIIQALGMFNQSLKMDFGCERPLIAVLGLNPHAGEEGTIGKEDEEIIRPAIIETKKSGIMVAGPYPADGFFGSGQFRKFDGILAMYHDQGLIPFKLMAFGKGTNFTAGLRCVRTSPDHGTAFDIAGKNEADPSSFRHAIFQAIDLIRQRQQYRSDRENPLSRKEKKREEENLTSDLIES